MNNISFPTFTVHPDLVTSLRQQVSGRIAYPADASYTELVTGHDVAADHRPAVVVEPVDADDVQQAVSIATAHGLSVSVQATGHGTGGPVRGGLMLATRRLDSIVVDPQAMTVTVGAGVTWGPLAAAVDEHGLMAITTNGPSVGVVGSTLGGGIGPLARRHGYCAQQVEALDVVTADGFQRRVTSGSDLFWALCGGRDGIGIVTAMTLRLQPAAALWGGELVWTDELDAALAWWHRTAGALPDSVTTNAMSAIAPDVPDVPEPLRGRPMLRVTVCASEADRADLLAAIAAAPTPAVAAVGPLTIADFLARHGDVAPPMPTWQRGFALVDLTAEALDVVLELVGPASQAPVLGVEIRRLGGTLARPADDAVSGRDAGWLVSIIGAPEPALFAQVLPQLAQVLETSLEPWSTGGSLLNFHGRPGPDHEIDRAWTPAVNARLARIRSDVDPQGTFTRRSTELPSAAC